MANLLNDDVPEGFKQRLALVAAKFNIAHPELTKEEVVEFMTDVAGIIMDYMTDYDERNN